MAEQKDIGNSARSSCHWSLLLEIGRAVISRRVKPRIKAAPRAGQIYWCDFSKDAHLPEFSKTRPVVILSHNNTLTGHCIVLPASTKPQLGKWERKLSIRLSNQESWVVCNHICTVAASRLHPHHGTVPKLGVDEFGHILELALSCIPKPKNRGEP